MNSYKEKSDIIKSAVDLHSEAVGVKFYKSIPNVDEPQPNKKKITNDKIQITNKFQIPNVKSQIFNFEFW